MDNFRPNHMNRVFHSGAVSDTIEASGGMDMQIRLAENIRALRRQHRFTQEQLAESLAKTARERQQPGREDDITVLVAELVRS